VRLSVKAMFLFASIGAITAYAQTVYNTPIQHVIVVVQENRTPDNIFGSNPTFESGVNLVTVGNSYGASVPLTSTIMTTCYDPDHQHRDFEAMWDNGLMDGANGEGIYNPDPLTCTVPQSNVPFAYIENDKTTNPPNTVAPYFQIAKQYGFANYMFQTNQGSSFPAHQFLLSGTSAPVAYPNKFYDWFSAESPASAKNSPVGCTGALGEYALEISPTPPYHEQLGYAPPGANAGFPCYTHNTLIDVLNSATSPISWKYYAQTLGLWTAPTAMANICEPSQPTGGACTGAAFTGANPNVVLSSAQVLTDIQNCVLPQVSWATPDGVWSDHSGGTLAWGPSWVAAIVNAIGHSACVSPAANWSNTAILITWDDWGGWYDHVAPPIGYAGNGTGNQYVYGFRVPLLVVSAYMTKPGYVSGSWNGIGSAPTTCPGPPYCHDFGSILNFIEYVFGSNQQSLGQIGPAAYPYADSFVQDIVEPAYPYSLSDFFNFQRPPSRFTTIRAPLDASFFINYKGAPQDPDDDADED
jgi:hypothetical protein